MNKPYTLEKIMNSLSYGYEFKMSDYAGSLEQESMYEREGKAQIAEAIATIQQLIKDSLPEKKEDWKPQNKDQWIFKGYNQAIQDMQESLKKAGLL